MQTKTDISKGSLEFHQFELQQTTAVSEAIIFKRRATLTSHVDLTVMKYRQEYVTLWSLSILFFPGDDCRVRDPRSGYEFNLSSLKGKVYPVQSDKYTYHLSICEGLQKDVCTHKETAVSSCQVEGNNHKIAGTKSQKTFSCLYYTVCKNLCHYSCIYPFLCVCLHVYVCRNGKPASELCGRPAHSELH